MQALRPYHTGSAFEAGTDTTTGTVLWLLMAMALYPATMKKAQQEIDSLCTSKKIPGFAQMNDLPYCFAPVKEVFQFSIIPLCRACFNRTNLFLRWSPAAPGGFPH
jgi:cytochrome P450